jgi:hypothetical protein
MDRRSEIDPLERYDAIKVSYDTLKETILFGCPVNEKRYRDVLRA